MEDESSQDSPIDPSLYANETGEAEVLPCSEMCTDFGLQNAISPAVLNQLLT